MQSFLKAMVCLALVLGWTYVLAEDPPTTSDEGVFTRAFTPGETTRPGDLATTTTAATPTEAGPTTDTDLAEKLGLAERLLGIDFRPRLGGTYYFEEDTDQAGSDLEWYEARVDFAFPIRRGRTTDVAGYVNLGYTDFNNHGLIIPMTGGAKFPGELYDIELGVFFTKKLDGGRTLGGRVAVGSPSDDPFNSWDEISLKADLFYQMPWRTNMSWIFFLSYANTREYDFPLPGAALLWKPSDQLTVIAGIPVVAATWKPSPRWEFNGVYIMPRTVNLEAAYNLTDSTKIYGAFDWDSRDYFREGRADDDDRLQYYEKRLSLGVRCKPMGNVFIDLGGGYAFDRFWFEDDDYDDRGDTRIDIDDGLFVMLQVGIDLGIVSR